MHHLFKRKSLIIFATFSFCVFIFSLLLAFVILPPIIDSQIDKNIRLERGTDQWERFRELPFDIYLNVTLFRVNNVEEVKKGARPNLTEQGPYVFGIDQKRIDLAYDEETDLISYKRDQKFTFNKEMSGEGLSLDDTIDMINPAHIGILQMAPDFLPNIPGSKKIGLPAVNKCLNKMFETTDDYSAYVMKNFPVRNLLFDGFKVCDFNDSKCKVLGINICDQFKQANSKNLEEVYENNGEIHYLKFSLFNYKNITTDGLYQIKSGITDTSELGDTRLWNDMEYTNYWRNDTMDNKCNKVKGTDTTIYQPHLSPDTKITVYSTDICRTVDLFYTGEGTYAEIDGYYYKPKPEVFYPQDGSSREDDCYCLNTSSSKTMDINGSESCFLNGVIDVRTCIGAPVLVSSPHFLYADESYLEELDGDIKPDKEKHEMYVLLDKYTGIPLQAHEKVQLNIVLRPLDNFKDTETFKRVVLPIAWIDIGIDLPPVGVDLLNSVLYDTLKLVNILKWVFIGASLTLTIVAGIFVCRHFYRT